MSSSQRRSTMRVPPFFRRLFKFTSMDFETAVWEMTHLIIAPKKVFRNIYYHKQTKNSYHRADPAFTYLLALFLLLTGFAWGVAYAPGLGGTIRVTLVFVFVHFLGTCLAISTLMYFLVGRVLGKRRQGLFGPPIGGGGAEDALEFGYCFDVSIRAYLPIWTFLYVLQFLLMPLIAQDYRVSNFFGNTMYLMALSYYFVITFLGYNGAIYLNIGPTPGTWLTNHVALPFLSRTEILLAPIPVLAILWLISLFTFDCATNLAPILWCGIKLRKPV
ncbi:UNC-50 protein [Acrodontium crateriforme]|uniref:UNC-50 protein n=1 Tax=Acrodontium crateriforme TaxID=150365 RepID=A0AAQ3LYT2_9PEZI|nr:UNC-50 protein [Acrodontium crateriforme]